MAQRIREGMRCTDTSQLGGEGEVVEAYETYYGKPDITPTVRTSGQPFGRGRKSGRGLSGKRLRLSD
jgi:hypothetical protein